jgi:hypothetical protein
LQFLSCLLVLRDLPGQKRAVVYGRRRAAALCGQSALGESRFGSKNWISVARLPFSPRIIKIAFIYAGASTLDRCLPNEILLFIGLPARCELALFMWAISAPRRFFS